MPHKEKTQSFLQKLLQKPPELPFEPMLLSMLFAVTREESAATTDDLVALVERSQALAARVLTVANSAAYGLEFQVSSLRRAVTVLGFREIRLLAILVGTASIIKNSKFPPGFDAVALWQHQLRTAVIAQALLIELQSLLNAEAALTKDEDRLLMAPDEAYAAGFLHDIGKFFFASCRSDFWEDVEKIRQKSGRQFFEAENEYWGIDHALIGAAVLHAWKLPLVLTEPINWHHTPELAPVYKLETRLLAAADKIAHSGFDTDGVLPEEAVGLLPEGCDADALGLAVAQHLAKADLEALVGMVE